MLSIQSVPVYVACCRIFFSDIRGTYMNLYSKLDPFPLRFQISDWDQIHTDFCLIQPLCVTQGEIWISHSSLGFQKRVSCIAHAWLTFPFSKSFRIYFPQPVSHLILPRDSYVYLIYFIPTFRMLLTQKNHLIFQVL